MTEIKNNPITKEQLSALIKEIRIGDQLSIGIMADKLFYEGFYCDINFDIHVLIKIAQRLL